MKRRTSVLLALEPWELLTLCVICQVSRDENPIHAHLAALLQARVDRLADAPPAADKEATQ